MSIALDACAAPPPLCLITLARMATITVGFTVSITREERRKRQHGFAASQTMVASSPLPPPLGEALDRLIWCTVSFGAAFVSSSFRDPSQMSRLVTHR